MNDNDTFLPYDESMPVDEDALIDEMVELGEDLLAKAYDILASLDGRALGKARMEKTVNWLRGFKHWSDLKETLDLGTLADFQNPEEVFGPADIQARLVLGDIPVVGIVDSESEKIEFFDDYDIFLDPGEDKNE